MVLLHKSDKRALKSELLQPAESWGRETLQLISAKRFHVICFYVEVKSTWVDLYRLLVEPTSASCEDGVGGVRILRCSQPKSLVDCQNTSQPIFSQRICEGWASKGTQQGGDEVVDFIHFSTLIVYKRPFKSRRTPAAPCIFDGNGRAGHGEAASGRKLAARCEREWTPLRNKVHVTKKYYIKVISGVWWDELNGANPHQRGWILLFVFIHDHLVSALSDDLSLHIFTQTCIQMLTKHILPFFSAEKALVSPGWARRGLVSLECIATVKPPIHTRYNKIWSL